MKYVKKIYVLCILIFFIQSCTINLHTADRAIMLDRTDTETIVYGTATGGEKDYNLGIGTAYRKGVTDKLTFGIEGEVNYNSITPDWSNVNIYGKISIEQKMALWNDIIALKLTEGLYLNNYFGAIKKNEITSKKELISPERIIPFTSALILITPNGRIENKKTMLTFNLKGGVAYRRTADFLPCFFGVGALFDFRKNYLYNLAGFEIGIGLQKIKSDWFDAYINIGVHFSIFNREKTKNKFNNKSIYI